MCFTGAGDPSHTLKNSRKDLSQGGAMKFCEYLRFPGT